MDSLECFPMGSSALLLAWKSPQEVNGKLTGFRIYYQEVDGTQLGPVLERQPRIINPQSDKAKLAGLRPHSKYRVCILLSDRLWSFKLVGSKVTRFNQSNEYPGK